ncbi:guanine nucleotide-binding protein-like 3 [Trichechus manatus latirostris]|uniref:Guanine nucleotide-binding protein-like 3 n=1 Tax=Trichechus manatus latirostris TaxID=127582 RepID=A0A2Y9QKA8_TRIMA|nr:guanine nucleotide-binding protein-like 3 [Trichechus manatus latirostris]
MKRPKLKKASKRMTCHKRYKIQKKVREHHRKLRKEAKKRGRKKPRKDPGVPNSAPFKEALLREAELRKQRLEELKQQQKLDRQKEQEKKRKLETNPGVEPSSGEAVKEVIEASDVVLEVLDARDPLGCRCPQVEEAIVKGGQKRLVLVLNKSDCPFLGFPNVGKSSIINSLKQERTCSVGVSMGLTRNMQVVPLDKQITIIDSPSIIVSPLNSATALAMRSPASIEVVKPVEAASAILSQADARQVVLKFTVPEYKNPLEFFTSLAQRRGLHQKGGSPNVEGAAKLLWSEWTGATLGYYCQPPTSWTCSSHFNESVVADMKLGFNMEELEKNNAHSMQAIRGSRLASSVLFQSSGLTNGIIEEADIPEELTKQKERQQEENVDSDQESVGGEEADEKSSDMSPVEETWQALPEESQAGEQFGSQEARSFVLDKTTKEEDDAYDFSTDYV